MFSALRLPTFLRGDWQLMEALPIPTLVYVLTGPRQNRDSRTPELQQSLLPLQTQPTQSKGWAVSGL